MTSQTFDPKPQQTPLWWSARLRSCYAIFVMCLAVSATYIPITPPEYPPGIRTMLMGIDFMNIHIRRIRYASEAVFGPQGYLPNWHTRELGGSPFRANLQSFPLIPTRLLLFFLRLDPYDMFAPAV